MAKKNRMTAAQCSVKIARLIDYMAAQEPPVASGDGGKFTAKDLVNFTPSEQFTEFMLGVVNGERKGRIVLRKEFPLMEISEEAVLGFILTTQFNLANGVEIVAFASKAELVDVGGTVAAA